MLCYENPEVCNMENKNEALNLKNKAQGKGANKVKQLKDIQGKVNQVINEVNKIQLKNPVSQQKKVPQKKNPLQEAKERYEVLRKNVTLKESNKILVEYGDCTYPFEKKLSKEYSQFLKEDLLNKHKLTSNLRTKMVDWMIEVMSVYNCSNETFFLSVHIMDLFIKKTEDCLQNENIHLIGMVSMLIASKFEDVYPIHLKEMVSKIGHKIYHESVYRQMERKILNTIGVENLVYSSTYEFIKTFFHDFSFNNMKGMKDQNSKTFFENVKETAIFLSKLVCHFEKFYKKDFCFNALAIIVAAISIAKEKKEDLCSQECEIFLQAWIKYLMEQNSFDSDEVVAKSQEVLDAYNEYFTIKGISQNLRVFSPLSYLLKEGL